MKQEIDQIIKEKLENNNNVYITLAEIEEILDKKIEYLQLVNVIRNFISDGFLKAVRKKYEWQNSITFFEI